MADSSSDLSAVLKDALESRGVLGEIQAKLRAEVYKVLDDQSVTKPDLCRENWLINELIREYLKYNNYNYTSSVMLAETGQPKEPLERELLARELQLPLSGDGDVPLLYHMLASRTHHQAQSTRPDGDSNHFNQAHAGPVSTRPDKPSKLTISSRCVVEEPCFSDSP